MAEQDKMSEEIFPTRKCENCYNTVRYTNYDKYILKRAMPYTLCKKCNDEKQQNKNRTAYSAYCTECGNKFAMTQGEVDFYQSHGFDLLERCPKCRGTTKTEQRPHDIGKFIFSSFFK